MPSTLHWLNPPRPAWKPDHFHLPAATNFQHVRKDKNTETRFHGNSIFLWVFHLPVLPGIYKNGIQCLSPLIYDVSLIYQHIWPPNSTTLDGHVSWREWCSSQVRTGLSKTFPQHILESVGIIGIGNVTCVCAWYSECYEDGDGESYTTSTPWTSRNRWK